MAGKEGGQNPKRRKGHKVAFLELPPELHDLLKRIAQANERSMNGEATVAIRKHCRAERDRLRKQGVDLGGDEGED
jgi:hypothetical protein